MSRAKSVLQNKVQNKKAVGLQTSVRLVLSEAQLFDFKEIKITASKFDFGAVALFGFKLLQLLPLLWQVLLLLFLWVF